MVAWEQVSENNDIKEETDKSQEAEELFVCCNKTEKVDHKGFACC